MFYRASRLSLLVNLILVVAPFASAQNAPDQAPAPAPAPEKVIVATYVRLEYKQPVTTQKAVGYGWTTNEDGVISADIVFYRDHASDPEQPIYRISEVARFPVIVQINQTWGLTATYAKLKNNDAKIWGLDGKTVNSTLGYFNRAVTVGAELKWVDFQYVVAGNAKGVWMRQALTHVEQDHWYQGLGFQLPAWQQYKIYRATSNDNLDWNSRIQMVK